MSEQPKFCRDCKFARADGLLGMKYATCERKGEARTSRYLVTGETETVRLALGVYCSVERMSLGTCGPDATFYEPRPLSWWERLIGRKPRQGNEPTSNVVPLKAVSP